MSRLTRDGTAEPISRDQILRHARGQGNIIFPVQLTTSRIGNLTRLIHTLLYVMTIHTYIHTYKHEKHPVEDPKSRGFASVYAFRTCPLKSPGWPAHAGCASGGTYVSFTTKPNQTILRTIEPSTTVSQLTVSRDQILSREQRGEGNIHCPI